MPSAESTTEPAVALEPAGSAVLQRPKMQRRQKIFLATACACALVSMTGLLASAVVKSPAQLAADSQPPTASVLTAPVEYRVLTNTLVTRGTVAASNQFAVTPQTSTQGASVQVVTGARVAPGDHIRPGQILVEVSGRPLFALPGALPAYRDLRPDDDGVDVRQLQQALASLGDYSGGDASGHFGPATKQAIAKLYSSAGYDVPTTGGHNDEGDAQALNAAQAAVDAAQRSVDDMRRQIAVEPTPAPSSGAEPVSVQLTYLEKALTQAQRAQSDLIARTGPMLPLAEAVFLPRFPAEVTQLGAKVGDVVKAPLITLSSGQLVVTAQLTPDERSMVRVGMRADLVSEVLGLGASGTVTAVGLVADSSDASSTTGDQRSETGSLTLPVTIIPSSELPIQWAGQDIRVTITASATAGPVYVVPLSAVTANAAGQTNVSVVKPGGKIVHVSVTAGISGDGYVEITPIHGDIEAGDRVVIGS